MKILIESFANLVYLAVIVINSGFFIKNGIFTTCVSSLQRFLQSIYFTSYLFLIIHEYKLLTQVYKITIYELENTAVEINLRTLQYIGDNMLISTIMYSFALVLDSFKNFRIKEMKDRKYIKFSIISYASIRLLVATYIQICIRENIVFYSFIMEMFLVSEYLILVFVTLSLREVLKKLENEVNVCLMNDKTHIRHILSSLKGFSTKYIVAFMLQSIYRISYIAVIFNDKFKPFLFLKDISGLLKIVSIHFILDSINNLLVFNDPKAVEMCGDNENDKFFVFEQNKKVEG